MYKQIVYISGDLVELFIKKSLYVMIPRRNKQFMRHATLGYSNSSREHF